MHPPSATFLGGLRVYKIVLLGEGGVGKSGGFVHRFTGGIREQTLVEGAVLIVKNKSHPR